jgi:hypothetical protein
LGLRGFACSQPLEPKTGFDEILNSSILSLSICESDDLIGEPCNKRDEDHPRGHLISKGKMMRDEGKEQDAHHHDDEQEARPTSGMEVTETLHPIDHQFLSCLEGKDRLVLCTMILKNTLDLFEKRDDPEVSEEDSQSYNAIEQIE